MTNYREIFESQKARHPQIRARGPKERAALLRKLRDSVQAHAFEIKAAVQKDFGKSPAETDLTEIYVSVMELNHAAKSVKKWMRPRQFPTPMHMMGTSSEIRYEPKGCTLVIGPWNYPVQLVLAPLAAAVAAGCCVIVKPSELTPATSGLMAKIIREVFDPEEVTFIQGDAAVTQELLKLPFDHIFFTGSTKVGKIVMEAAAKNLTSVSLELGGKSPAIFDESVSMAAACERLVWGKFVNAGQTCIAPDYAWVPESRLEEFLSECRKSIEKAYGPGPDAWKKSEDFARIISDRNFGRLKAMLYQTVAEGAQIAIGGDSDPAQKYIAPTILTGVKASHAVMSEEIFGPILPVLTYKSLEGEVLPMIQKGERPLALYVFSEKARRVREVLDQTMSGGVCVNNTLIHIASPHLPFGGVGPSGLGSYHGEYGFKSFSHERAVVYQDGPNITRLFFPPYTARVKKLLKLAMRFLAG